MSRPDEAPLVSCIMPTADRPQFVRRAVEWFRRQTWSHRELVVVDAGRVPIAGLLPDDLSITYLRAPMGTRVGTMRNSACDRARGELIAHWDDDDWFAPTRLERQVAAVRHSGKAMCGITSPYYFDLTSGRAWRYVGRHVGRPWLTMLMYRRALWRRHRFSTTPVGSDTRFVWSVPRREQLEMAALDAAALMVCSIHGDNVSPKNTDGPSWQSVPVDEVRRVVGDDWRSFAGPTVAPTSSVGGAPWVVVITACDRPDWLEALLGDLARAADGSPIDVRVYDDGSEADMSGPRGRVEARGWRWHRAECRHGKPEYWRLMGKAIADLRDVSPDAFVALLPDDVRVCERFFTRATEAWAAIDDPMKMALTVLADAWREGQPSWTGVTPQRRGAVWRTQWIDGAFVAPRALFEALDFEVLPVSAGRWRRDPQLSSGVGRQLSLRLAEAGHALYCVHESLVDHRIGPSRMTPSTPDDRHRTLRFVDRTSWTVVVHTYDRVGPLSRLLDDLERAPERLDVRVYDDATPSDVTALRRRVEVAGWQWHRAPRRYGKRGFWRWVSEAWGGLRDLPPDRMLVCLPDDVRLCDQFFGRAREHWEAIDDSRRIALNVLVDASRGRGPCWTGVAPSRIGRVWRTQWVDGAFVADRRFLEALDFCVPPVDPARWSRDATLSSGVGWSVSRRLHSGGWSLYQVDESLVVHVDGPSKMNAAIRHDQPMTAVGFVDGDVRARALASSRPPIVAALATIPARRAQLARTVQSLLPQVDRLCVYLNGHRHRPPCLSDPRIEVVSSRQQGDRGDAGKFYWCDDVDCFYLSCDDDIIYPINYAERMVAAVERYDRRAVIGLHGVLIHPRVRSYYRDRTVLHCGQPLARDRPVHLVGTGCAAWHGSTLRVEVGDFPRPNMADIWFGLVCQRQDVPAIAVARPEGWLTIQPVRDTIYDRHRHDDRIQTRLVTDAMPWRVRSIGPRGTIAKSLALGH